jgi:hypothetical protein
LVPPIDPVSVQQKGQVNVFTCPCLEFSYFVAGVAGAVVVAGTGSAATVFR